MLLDDESTAAAVDEVLACATPPALVVNHATVSPECARACASRCASAGAAFVSCPVTGRPDKAASGQLACWVSASDASAAAVVADALCPAFASRVAVLSTSDAATAATFKLATNFLIYGGAELLAEATALAAACGLPRTAVAQFVSVVAPGTFLDGYAARIRDRAYANAGAGMDVGLKDIGLIRRLAGGAPLPALEAVREHCSAASAALGAAAAQTDWCAMAEEVERRVLRAQRGGA